MKKLLLVAHAPSPNTVAMLTVMSAACARAPDLDCRNLTPFAADATQVRGAAGLILFTPENFGYMSGALKDFFDRIYYPCLEHTQGLPYCLCVRAGQDNGRGTRIAVGRITTGLRWREVQPPLICAGAWAPEFCEQAAEFAEGFAQGLAMGVF